MGIRIGSHLSLKSWSWNITINFTIWVLWFLCSVGCHLETWETKSAHLVAAASRGATAKGFLWIEPAIYRYLTWKRTPQLQKFLGVWRFEKAWEISCQLVREWHRSWNRETQKSWDFASLHLSLNNFFTGRFIVGSLKGPCQAICYLFKKFTLVFASIEFQK